MTSPVLTISIDRTGMPGDPSALALSGSDDATTLGITNYREPALQPRRRDAPSADDMDGEQTLGWSWQETLLTFDVVTDTAATETDAREQIDELRAAVSRLSFAVTVTVGDAPAETWAAKVGSVTPAGDRSLSDLANHNAVWNVVIPCHPVRS